jgi:hypothetical protein
MYQASVTKIDRDRSSSVIVPTLYFNWFSLPFWIYLLNIGVNLPYHKRYHLYPFPQHPWYSWYVACPLLFLHLQFCNLFCCKGRGLWLRLCLRAWSTSRHRRSCRRRRWTLWSSVICRGRLRWRRWIKDRRTCDASTKSERTFRRNDGPKEKEIEFLLCNARKRSFTSLVER